jgi:polar amino acid transport system substrate-binding protein
MRSATPARATPVRLEHFVSSAEPVMENRYVFFHRRDDRIAWRRFEDLAGIPIAGTVGFNYGDRFREALAAGSLDVPMCETTKASFEKLLAGEVHLFAHDQGVGHENLRACFPAEIAARITYHTPMTDHPLSNVIFSHGRPDVREPARRRRTRARRGAPSTS